MAREKNLSHLPFDTQKTPLPPADSEPTYAGWREWLETIRPLAEAQHYAGLTGSQRQMLSLGMAGVVEGLEAPDLELAVPYEIYREKLQAAKVIEWDKEKAAAVPTFPPPSSVLDEVRKNPEFKDRPAATDESKFDLDAWRNEVWQPQITLWENQFKPNGAINAPVPKYELHLWATNNLLPLLKKAPTVWPVYCYLLVLSPEDFSTFKVSKAKLARGAAVSPESTRTAVEYLVAWKFLTIKHGLWSPKGSKAAVLPEYKLTTLEGLKKVYAERTNC